MGMELTEVVPRGSNEHTFLEAQSKYFGFYDMYIVTKVSGNLLTVTRLLRLMLNNTVK